MRDGAPASGTAPLIWAGTKGRAGGRRSDGSVNTPFQAEVELWNEPTYSAVKRVSEKGMKEEKSCEAAELNADHRQLNPGLRTPHRALVVADKSTMLHQPAERAFDNPASRQHSKALGRR